MSKIAKKRGIVVALDVEDLRSAIELAKAVAGLQGNFAIKIGRPLEMQVGIKVISEIKKASSLPVIYDGKIADIPFISSRIARAAYDAGADAVIVHAMVGQDVMEELLKLGQGDVIALVSMTHPGSGKFIDPLAAKMAQMANSLGVHGLVLPSTKPEILRAVSGTLKGNTYVIAPGIKAQGAGIGDAIRNGADYEIVGRAIYNATDPKRVSEDMYRQIMAI